MSETQVGHARCLCGSVSIQAEAMSRNVGSCHCSTCRKWAGGPMLSVSCGKEVALTGEEHISIYDSSAWAERGFCKNCGSHLFYRIKENQEYIIPIGLFDNAEGLTFQRQVFIDEKPDYYSFANNTLNMTGAEIFALYGVAQEEIE